MEKKLNIAIIGAGAWGCTLANYLDYKNKGEIFLYPARQLTAEYLIKHRSLPKLSEIKINESINIRREFNDEIKKMNFILLAISSKYVRETCRKLLNYVSDQIIISVTKGLEENSLNTSSEVISNVLNTESVAVLSGPALAIEIQKGLPTALVIASEKEKVREILYDLFRSDQIKIIKSECPRQVEIVAAMKNLVAMIAGLSDGMKYGANFKAVLMTEIINELHCLCKDLNIQDDVFYGVAGLGDAIATASGLNSRNYKFGFLLGSGYNVKSAKQKVGMSIEGVNLIGILKKYIEKESKSYPIVESLYRLTCEENLDKNSLIAEYLKR